MRRAPDGGVYAHIEYIVLLRSRNECKNVIEYIRSNASVFLSMEYIDNDSERQRCVDMLSGAAYTLGCSLNRISPRGIYLISSPSVYVVMDPSFEKFAAAHEGSGFARQNYEGGGYATSRMNAGYPGTYPHGYSGTGYRQQREAEPRGTSRFAREEQDANSYPQRRPSASFGSVMAGNSGSYPSGPGQRGDDARTGPNNRYGR